jgi:hypothetical protein
MHGQYLHFRRPDPHSNSRDMISSQGQIYVIVIIIIIIIIAAVVVVVMVVVADEIWAVQ